MRIKQAFLNLLLTMSILFASASFTNAYAQNRTLKGVVVDDTEMGVIGAAVMVKGTTNGVATDIDGNSIARTVMFSLFQALVMTMLK